YNNFGVMLQTIGRFDEAERAFRRALQFRERLLSVSPDDPDYREDLASCHNNLGNLLPLLGRSNAAEEANVKAISLREELAAEFPKSSRIRSNLGGSLNNLADLLSKRGDHVQAKHMVENAIAHQQAAMQLIQNNTTFPQSI